MALAVDSPPESRVTDRACSPDPCRQTEIVHARRSDRLPLVDAIRLLCAAWVMWVHIPQSQQLQPTTAFGRFRLPTFVILSVFFLFVSQKNHPQRTYRQYMWARLRIIYLPFVAWAVFYLIYDYVLSRVAGQIWTPVGIGFLFNGHTAHLWFLPFILAVGLFMFPIARWLLGVPVRSRWIVPLCLFVGLAASAVASPIAGTIYRTYVVGMNHQAGARDMLYRTVTLMPCVPIAVGIFYLFRVVSRRSHRMAGAIGLFGLGLFAVCIAVNCVIPTNTVLESTAGISLVFIAFARVRSPAFLWLAKWGRFSYGMYLVHIFFVTAFQILRQRILQFSPAPWYDLLTLIACVFLSLFTAILLSCSRYTRWLVPGSHPSTQDVPPSSEVRFIGHLAPVQRVGG
jgi:peptidoglycan/LPS O-acetylase OafA/YrhL